jgi:hypothetical protein
MSKKDDLRPPGFRVTRGHFGEQQGDAGQLKEGVAPVVGEKTEADRLADDLARLGITIDVLAVKHLSTGTVVSLFGPAANVARAQEKLAKTRPDWTVRHHKPPKT